MKADLVYLHPGTLLGEGPVWNHFNDRLIWLDILGHKIHQYDPESGKFEIFQIGHMVSCLAPIDETRYVCASKGGFGILDLNNQQIKFITNPESAMKNNRFNDGKCDPFGRFWAGSMSMNHSKGLGALYCLDADFNLKQVLSGISISNGLAWSEDASLMYYIDSLAFDIAVYDYDNESGTISNRRTLCSIDPAKGAYDGMTIDEDGRLWVAVYNAGVVQCIDPLTGAVVSEVTVNAARTSSCTFGGKNMDMLFITTIAEENPPDNTCPGGLFMVKPGCKGRVAHVFKPA